MADLYDHLDRHGQALCNLKARALALGAARAALIPAGSILARHDLADLCRSCPSFGLALSCPPHVQGPDQFRQWLGNSSHALVFCLEKDTACLQTHRRHALFRTLHETAAGLETHASRLGFPRAMAFAGGSCKPAFCGSHESCQALAPRGLCRYPETARPSMSGFGIDVAGLIRAAGWESEPFLAGRGLAGPETSGIYGLVLPGPQGC